MRNVNENIQIGPYFLQQGAAIQLELIPGESCHRNRLSIWSNPVDYAYLLSKLCDMGLGDQIIFDSADRFLLEWTSSNEPQLCPITANLITA